MEMEKILSLAKELGISPEEMLKKLEKKKKEESSSSEEAAKKIKEEHVSEKHPDFVEKRIAKRVIRRRKKVVEEPVEDKKTEDIQEPVDTAKEAPEKPKEETKEKVVKKRGRPPKKKSDEAEEEKKRIEFEKAKEKLEKKLKEQQTVKRRVKPVKIIKEEKEEEKTKKVKTIEKTIETPDIPVIEESKKEFKDKKLKEKTAKEKAEEKKKTRKQVKKFKTIFDKRKKLKDVSITDDLDDIKGSKKGIHVDDKKPDKEKADKKKLSTMPIVKESKRKIKIESEHITVGDLAKKINVKASELIKKLMANGIMATINNSIDIETATLIAEEYGYEIEKIANIEEKIIAQIETEDKMEDLKSRPPVVTIMGHVDHGKTSLLDRIRETNVTDTEAGGITQHIGAYFVEIDGNHITFIDTPGHEAFTAMRARGAMVTDIVVLIVAADDGVMPQTVEAIQHAQAANVPIIVAINKIDKPNANVDKVVNQLMEHNLVPEEFGGDTLTVKVSAKTGEGIKDLLESILIQSEILELKANPNKNAKGYIIESRLEKGRGSVATILVTEGTLHVGDCLVAGNYFCKVRAMNDYTGKKIKEAPPSTPVEILGFNGIPDAGEIVMALKTEKEAKELIEHRINKEKEKEQKSRQKISLEDLQKQILEGELKELNVIIKADVQGTSDAIKTSLEKLKNEEVAVKIIASGVGGVTEGDVLLAQASHAIIVGFNVRPDSKARKLAEKEHIEIKTYSVIYDLIDDIKKALEGLLSPEFEEEYHGRAEVRQTFNVPKVGTVAGCYVVDGKITRNSKIRLLRDNVIVYEGELASLKRFKDDVREVQAGYECGMGMVNFNDIKVGDIIEAYDIIEKSRIFEE